MVLLQALSGAICCDTMSFAPAAHLSPGEVDNSSAKAGLCHFQQYAPGTDFDVIRMSPDRDQIIAVSHIYAYTTKNAGSM